MSGLGWYRLRRHPLTVEAHFVRSLVLTYAFEAADLARMLPPGLAVDRYGQWGFVAIALVETEALRPTILPRGFGQAFFLAGYRIFTTFKPAGGGTLRGLYILRSDTNRRLMATAGNLLTHYRYRVSQVMTAATTERFSCGIVTRDGAADLRVTANLAATRNLPPTTPFARAQDARRFAGPLPYTFDHERETHSIIVIKGVRKNWNPRLVDVRVDAVNFWSAERLPVCQRGWLRRFMWRILIIAGSGGFGIGWLEPRVNATTRMATKCLARPLGRNQKISTV